MQKSLAFNTDWKQRVRTTLADLLAKDVIQICMRFLSDAQQWIILLDSDSGLNITFIPLEQDPDLYTFSRSFSPLPFLKNHCTLVNYWLSEYSNCLYSAWFTEGKLQLCRLDLQDLHQWIDCGKHEFARESPIWDGLSSLLNIQFLVEDHWDSRNPCFYLLMNQHGEAPTEVWRSWYRSSQWSCSYTLETTTTRVVDRQEMRCGFIEKNKLVTFPLLDRHLHRSEANVVVKNIWDHWILQSFLFRGLCMPTCYAVTSQNLRLKFNISGSRYEFPENKKVDQLLRNVRPCQVLLGKLNL